MHRTALILTLALAVTLAGCTGGGDPPRETNTTTPPTGTTQPTGTTPPTNTPGTNETPDEGSPPLLCSDADGNATTGTRAGYPELVFTMTDATGADACAGFAGPTSADAGWTAITLRNEGMGMWILPMQRLGAGQTLDDLMHARGELNGTTQVGGVGGASPSSNGTIVLDLTVGTYVLMAVNVADESAPAMLRVLNVTAGNASAAAPAATLTITLSDFAFDVPANVTAGAHVVRIVNEGTQPHEAPWVKLKGNATMDAFLAAVSGQGPPGPPPGGLIGGVNVLSPGEEAYALVDLEAGAYGFVCFVPSHEHGGQPHFLLGMVKEFRVA